MEAPVMPRWLAPVLVVVFVLLTVWAAYNVVTLASASPSPGPAPPAVTFGATGRYSYDASLVPNTLFNSTNVSGTNVTLFTSITRWVNVTIVDAIALDVPATAHLSERFTVTVSTDDWSKTLVDRPQVNGSAGVTAVSVTDRYALNVSALEASVAAIDAQLNYTAPWFAVTLLSQATASIAFEGGSSTATLAPKLNLTFVGPLITASGTPSSSNGSVVASTGSSDPPSASTVPTVAYLELAGAAGALGVSVWLLLAGRRGPGAPAPSLARLIEPYQEVIARTARPPTVAAALEVEGWEDLVKVADTLGRPILRPPGSPGDPAGSVFYVMDGSVAYQYRYRPAETTVTRSARAGPAMGESGRSPSSPAAPISEARPAASPATPAPANASSAPRSPPPAPLAAPSGPVAVPVPTGAPAEPSRGLPPASRAPAAGKPAARPARLLATELARIREANLTPAELWYAYSLYSQTALAVISARDPVEATLAVENLRRALDYVVPGPAGPS